MEELHIKESNESTADERDEVRQVLAQPKRKMGKCTTQRRSRLDVGISFHFSSLLRACFLPYHVREQVQVKPIHDHSATSFAHQTTDDDRGDHPCDEWSRREWE